MEGKENRQILGNGGKGQESKARNRQNVKLDRIQTKEIDTERMKRITREKLNKSNERGQKNK